MYVDVLTVSQRGEERSWSEMTPDPGWSDIERAIRELDGQQRCLLTLASDDALLSIGGGDGRYLIHASLDSHSFQSAVEPAQPGYPVPVPLPGRQRSCPARMVLDQKKAMRVARAFALGGCLERSLSWEAC